MKTLRDFIKGFVISFSIILSLTFIGFISSYAEINIIGDIFGPIYRAINKPFRPMWELIGLLDNVENPGNLLDLFIPIIFWGLIGGLIAVVMRKIRLRLDL